MIVIIFLNKYADPIIDTIESQKKFFDYRLYRQHALIIENDFVKVGIEFF